MSSRLLLLLLLVVYCAPLTAPAQTTDPNGDVFLGGPKYKKDKAPTSRILKGTVTDDTGKPVVGALVTLVNKTSGEKLTFITKNEGRYHFDGLSFSIDYTVSAAFNGLNSEEKKLSQYDHAPMMVRILELKPPAASSN